MKVLLKRRDHPGLGTEEVTLPIPDTSYEAVIRRLNASGMGGVTTRDCQILTMSDEFPILKRMEDTAVNIDELDYLARWLETASTEHAAAFQALAYKTGIWRVEDFINLTACCHRAAIITDFSNWEKIGRIHYKACRPDAKDRELARVDFRAEALNLLLNRAGTVTPYGVLYENGMDISRTYDGGVFPPCDCPGDVLCLIASHVDTPAGRAAYLNLPMNNPRLTRAMERAGIGKGDRIHLAVRNISAPSYTLALDFDRTPIVQWNRLCRSISRLTDADRKRLNAVMEYAKPKTAPQMTALADNLGLFNCVPEEGTDRFSTISWNGIVTLNAFMDSVPAVE